MPAYFTPGVYFEPADRTGAEVEPLRTDIAGFVGLAQRGPLDQPVRVESWRQFLSRFGGFLPNAYLALAVRAFFENGGRRAWIVRVATDGASTVTVAGGQPADGFSSKVASIQGFTAGAAVTLRQGDRTATMLLDRIESSSNTFYWGRPVRPRFDIANPIELSTGVGAATASVKGADGRETWRLEAVDPGAWGDDVTVFVREAAGASAVARQEDASRLSVSRVGGVHGFERGALVRVSRRGAAAPPVFLEVERVDAVRSEIHWRTPLPSTGDWTLETVEHSLSVSLRNRLAESFAGLSPSPRSADYAPKTLAVSNHIRLIDTQEEAWVSAGIATSVWAQRLPAFERSISTPGLFVLAGGRDGIAGLTALRFHDVRMDGSGLERQRGFLALSAIDEVALVAAPDLVLRPTPPVMRTPLPPRPIDPCPCPPDPAPAEPVAPPGIAEQAPGFAIEDIFEAQATLVNECERLHDRVAILDTPWFAASETDLGVAETAAWRRRFDTTFGALYFPWALAPEPLEGSSAVVRAIPPSGHVCGMIAATDLAVGVHQAPANVELRWLQGLTAILDDATHGLLNPLGVNVLRATRGRGIRVLGARTMSSDTRWRFLNVRRLLLMIEEALDQALQWTAFEPNDVLLRQRASLAISSFLSSLWERGALRGATREEAFQVRCDALNNPPEERAAGRLLAEVSVAPADPAEFVVVRVGRTDDKLTFLEREGGRR